MHTRYQENDIVITGYGARTPLGYDTSEIINNMFEGKTAVRDVSEIRPHIGSIGGVKDPIGSLFSAYNAGVSSPKYFNFEPSSFGLDERSLERNNLRGIDPSVQLGLTVANEAMSMSGLDNFIGSGNDHSYDVGSIGASTVPGVQKLVGEWETFRGRTRYAKQLRGSIGNGQDFDRSFLFKYLPDGLSGHIAKAWHLMAGDSGTLTSSCASGASAIIRAADMIKLGHAQAMICTSVDLPGNEMVYKAFNDFRLLGTHEDPSQASRPFDKDRNGLVLGEGAASIVLERYSHAQKRGAEVLGILRGYASLSDTKGSFAEPNAVVENEVMGRALHNAGIYVGDLSHINLHATGTSKGDFAEAKAIHGLMLSAGGDVRLLGTANKSMTGHMFGTSGILESILTLYTLSNDTLPPTKNFEDMGSHSFRNFNLSSDPVSLGFGPHYALSNSFGFFGHNVSLVYQSPLN